MGFTPSIPTHTTWDTEHRCWAVPPVAAILLACALQAGVGRGSPYGLDGLPILLGVVGFLWLTELVWDWPETGQWIVLRLLGGCLLLSFHLGVGGSQPWPPEITGSPWHAALLVSLLNGVYLVRRYGAKWGDWGTPEEDDVWWRVLVISAWLFVWKAGDHLVARLGFALDVPEGGLRIVWALALGFGAWCWAVRGLSSRKESLVYVLGAIVPCLLALGCRP